MRIETFKRIRTLEQLDNILSASVTLNDEGVRDRYKSFDVYGSEFENLRYFGASGVNGVVTVFWFTYGEDSHLGLAKMLQGSTKVVKCTSQDYVKFHAFQNKTWACMRTDGTYDIYVNDKVVLTNVISHDTIDLDGVIACVQLDTPKHRHLLCLNMTDAVNGYFSPADECDFSDWFYKTVSKLGYEGHLDNIPLSGIISFGLEVQNCIFNMGDYRQITAVNNTECHSSYRVI